MSFHYETNFPESYIRGRTVVSVSISLYAKELLDEKGIDNISAFLNDLIIQSLRTEGFFDKKAMADYQAALEALRGRGFIVEVKGISKKV